MREDEGAKAEDLILDAGTNLKSVNHEIRSSIETLLDTTAKKGKKYDTA